MPETIDWPSRTDTPRPNRRKLLFLIAVIAVILFSSRIALSWWVDLLWFQSLTYADVFWKARCLEWGVFVAFAATTFFILFGAFSLLKRAHAADLPESHTVIVAGRSFSLPVAIALRFIAAGVSLLIALGTGAAMAAQWPALALFWYAPRTSGTVADPIFGKPLNFYLFTLPAWEIVVGWLLTLSVITCLTAALFILATGGARALSGRLSDSGSLPWRSRR